MKLLLLLCFIPMATCFVSGFPRGCHDFGTDVSLPSQVYTIFLGRFSIPVEVYCDMDTDKGGWTVFQKREGGIFHFYRPWGDYRNGFGDVKTEYWLGLENIRELTKSGNFELRVVLVDFEGNTVYANYDSFSIDEECDGYTLHVSGFRNGGAGDALAYHDGQKFSTFDRDQDSSPSNCAERYCSGFWYNSCYNANINGVYKWGRDIDHFSNGVVWAQWKGFSYSLKSTVMMVRPVHKPSIV